MAARFPEDGGEVGEGGADAVVEGDEQDILVNQAAILHYGQPPPSPRPDCPYVILQPMRRSTEPAPPIPEMTRQFRDWSVDDVVGMEPSSFPDDNWQEIYAEIRAKCISVWNRLGIPINAGNLRAEDWLCCANRCGPICTRHCLMPHGGRFGAMSFEVRLCKLIKIDSFWDNMSLKTL